MTALWAIAADLLAPLWPYIAAAGIAVAGRLSAGGWLPADAALREAVR